MAPGDHRLPCASAFPYARRVASADETAAVGRRLGALLKGGEIILLHGGLGAGKTCLVQGLGAELQVAEEVVSPTFTLVNTYRGRLKVHHLDFYRVELGHDLNDIGVPDLLAEIWDGAAVGVIEWPGPLLAELGAGSRYELLAEMGANPTERVWHLRGTPEVPPSWRRVFPGKGPAAC